MVKTFLFTIYFPDEKNSKFLTAYHTFISKKNQ
jgi:hypothetical protein